MTSSPWVRWAAWPAVVAVIAAATACSDNDAAPGSDGASGPIILARCYSEGELDIPEKPSEVPFGCDGTGTLQGMTWTAWGSSGADGTGSAVQTLCEPSCAAGTRSAYAVVVHAEDVKAAPPKCRVSFRYFSKLTVAYPNNAPESTDSTYKGMPSIEYDTTPICAVQMG